VFLEVLVGLVGRLLHGGFFAGTIHAFHLTIGPGVVDFRETRVDAICLAEAIEEMRESILIALPVGELDAGIREHGVDLVGYGHHQLTQALSGNPLARLFGPLGIGELADAVDRDAQVQLPCCCTDLGNGEVIVAKRIRFDLLLGRLVPLDVRPAADAMPLQTAMERGSGQVRQRRVQRLAAVIQRQPRVSTKGEARVDH
jgi:hypothetical protein